MPLRAILRASWEPAMSTTLLTLLLSAGCAPQIAVSEPFDDGSADGGSDDGSTTDGGTTDGGTTDGGTTTPTEPDYSEYDGATLQILSPESGAFYPLGEDVPFEAVILAADGSGLDFEDVVWTTTVDGDWEGRGTDFQDELTVGTHTITATAALPNGDRLGWTVSGVLVQHEDAGTYVGDLAVDFTVDYEGTPITTTCFGAATLYVDAWGEAALGESACTVSLLGYDLDTTYDFEFEVKDEELSGQAALDLVIFESQFDATGTLSDGELFATWEDSLLGYIDFLGELELTRISRDTEASE